LSTLVGRMPAGAVDLGGFAKAASVGYSVEDSMAASIVRLECENEELRATVAMLEAERDILRVQLMGQGRPATLEEIQDSVREKYDPEYEFGGRDE